MDNKFEKILRDHKLRITDMRKDILKIFLGKEEAISHQDIEALIEGGDRITIYRTLKSFQEKGLIHQALDHTGVAKYALCAEHCDEHYHHDEHVHFHCETCGNTFCVDDVEVPEIPMPSGYKVTSSSMVLNGTCERCNEVGLLTI